MRSTEPQHKPEESKNEKAEREHGPLTVPGTKAPSLKRPKATIEPERRMDTDYDPDPIAGRLPEDVRKEEEA